MKKEIRGKRIILREQREEDAPFFLPIGSTSLRLCFSVALKSPRTKKKIKRQITVDHRSEDSLWFTITDGEGHIVGETGLLRMFPAWH